MSARVVYSRRAAAEAEEINAFLAEHNPSAAVRFGEALDRAEQQLAQFPDSGARGARPGTRRLVIGSYIVSYRRRHDTVEIFAVRDARRRDARF